jgi:DNA gyrase subunit A
MEDLVFFETLSNLNDYLVESSKFIMIDNEHATIDDILKHVKGPDFPTGAVVYGGAPMIQAYRTGRGSVTMRAVADIVETKRGRHQIVISEIPYGVNKASMIEKIAELVKEKKITSIADLPAG